MTSAAFFLPRYRVALNLVALPLLLVRSMFRKAVDDFRDIRSDIIPALRYVLTGTSVPGATRAAVKAGVSQAATAVSSPVASFFRKYVRNRLVALGLLLLFPIIVPYIIVRVLYEEIEWADMGRCVLDLVFGIFDNRAV